MMGFLSAPSSSTFLKCAIFSSPEKKKDQRRVRTYVYAIREFRSQQSAFPTIRMVSFYTSYSFGFYSCSYYTNGVFLKDITIRDFIARLAILQDSAFFAPRDSRDSRFGKPCSA